MTIPLDLTTDGACFDALVAVTLRQPRGGATVSITGALARRVNSREAQPSGAHYLADEVDWHLPAALLNAPPEVGAVIADADGLSWTVLAVQVATLQSRYVCRARRLSIVGGLDALARLERATWIKDPSGAAEAVWVLLRADVRVRIQHESSQVALADQRGQARVTHRIYLSEEMPLDQDCRFVSGENVYRVVRWEQLQRLDALMVVMVEQVYGAAT